MPTRIVLLRHAEKPDDDTCPDLSLKGQVRAAALAVYLPNRFGKPSKLIAAKRSQESNRPALTLKPLSDALGLAIDTRYENTEFKSLAHELAVDPKYRDARIMICWHHGSIPQLAHVLGVHDVPDHWEDDVFDRIWLIEGFPSAPTLTRIHQKLLYGDND